MTGRLGRLAILLALGTTLLVAAFLLINTTFMMYDDEGYVLLTYRNFINGGRLYDEIFTQYGPWPYVYHLAVSFGLQSPITHMIGRNLTAIHWVLCALLSGAITARLTGQKIYAVVSALATFGLLWQMSHEPSHPGSLICATLVVGVLLTINFASSTKWAALGAVLGSVAALLVLTKINIGLLFIAGAGAAALRLTRWPDRWQKCASWLATAGLLLVPWGLMSANLREPWVLILAVQFTLSAAGLLWLTPMAREQRQIPPRTWLVALAVFTLTFALSAAIVFARGSSLSALFQAVFVAPLRLPTSFMISFTWKPAIWPVSILCWLLAARAGWELRQRGVLARPTRLAVLTLRLAVMGVFIVNAVTWLTLDGVTGFLIYCLPVLPLFVVPLRTSRTGEAAASSTLILWAASLALPQVLHTYPVAGSQMGWGIFLLVPIMVAGICDAWELMAEIFPLTGRRLPRLAPGSLLLVGGLQLALLLQTGWSRYQTSRPFNLPGAENIRADDRARLTLRILTQNARIHADTLFSRQGMFSYNIWSGVPTPTSENATHWFWLLDHPAQARIIDRLRQTPRNAVITSEALDEFLIKHRVPMACPLQTFIEKEYRSLFVLDGFHFLVPRTSPAVPFETVEVFSADHSSEGVTPTLLQTNVALDGRLVAAQLQEVNSPWSVRETYSPENARLVLQPITAIGAHNGPTVTLPQLQPLHGLFQLRIYTARVPELANSSKLELVGLDAQGRTLAEASF